MTPDTPATQPFEMPPDFAARQAAARAEYEAAGPRHVQAPAIPPTPRRVPTDEECALMDRQERDRQRRSAQSQCWREIITTFGRRYENASLGNFDVYDDKQAAVIGALKHFGERLQSHAELGDGLVLYGPSGTGKDHLLAALMRHAIFHHDMRVEWVDGMVLYGMMRDAIGKDEPEERVLRRFINAKILAVSDPVPPTGALTDFQASTLFRIIDARYRDCRPTWVTINVANGDEAAGRMGVQVVDRLKHGATVLHCNWTSYRARTETK